MLFVIKIVVVSALIKVLLESHSPMLCAVIYAVFRLILILAVSNSLGFLQVAVASAVSFGLGYLYFWSLDRFENSALFWIIMIVGMFFGLV